MASVGGFSAGSELLVNTATAGDQRQPSVVALAGGGFATLWMQGYSTVYGQLLSATGAKVGGEFYVAASQERASLKALPGGGFVVTWGDSSAVRMRIYDAAAHIVGADIVVKASAGYHDRTEVTPLASGGYVVTWTEYDAQGSFELRGQMLSGAGAAIGSEFAVASVSAGSQYNPRIAALSSGGFAVAWMDNGVVGSVAGQEVKGRLFDAAGSPAGAEFIAASASDGDQGQAVVAALPTGGFVMAWWTANPAAGDGSGYAIKAQLFDASGARTGGEFLVNTSAASNQYHPVVTVLPSGMFLIGWTDFSAQAGDTSGSAIRAQLFDGHGGRIGGELLVNQTTSGSQAWPALAANASGGFLALWEDASALGGDASGAAVKARLFEPLAARDDAFGTSEAAVVTGTLFLDNGAGPDGAVAQVALVNGVAASVGTTVTLASGALLTVNADGTFSYDPNHVFDALPDAASGAVNAAAYDSFTYTLTGGASATATVTVNGVASVGDRLEGDGSDNLFYVDDAADTVVEAANGGTDEVRTAVGSASDYAALYVLPANVENLTGTATGNQGVQGNALDNVVTMGGGNDLLVMSDGGDDRVSGGAGNDFFYFGAAFTAADRVDGGAGNDAVGLLGRYDLVLGEDTLTGVERFAVYSSGDPSAPNDYAVRTVDGNVAAGAELTVIAMSLGAGEHLLFDGSNESDGRFNVRGGHGDDVITGGGGDDRLCGGEGADLLRGGEGTDQFEYRAVSDSTGAAFDTILDFTAGEHINLAAIDANGEAGGKGVFHFIGADAFSHSAGELRAYEADGHWWVEGDVDGDGAADLVICVAVADGHALARPDFYL
ncbi:MAG: calcium-binding protein [Alphaproteobacteria bacterium]|nr:calcium-binding protein [Alphaproteobacteria bacterium]MBV9373291.1 calcium-binding protein [Alphaproteobacteria bacterium]MBV9901254.1 calcium-binding protein [Alphaproteobacteria bacterium]